MPMYQPEIETMSQEQIRKLQSERLVKQVRHVYDKVPYLSLIHISEPTRP